MKTAKERFDSKWEEDELRGCWLWTAACYGTGYGVLRVNGRNHHAHRMSWRFHRGEIPEGMHVLHKCDVRSCVNPDHLFLGTNDDNIQDCISKGRWACGEKAAKAKLTTVDIIEIIRLHNSGLGYKKLGKQFGVDFSTIYKITKRKRWRHLPC
jgi:hypothetical protein